jgi:hypothetical protein
MTSLTNSTDAPAASESASATPAGIHEGPITVKHQNIAEWHGKDLVDRDMRKIGKLEDVYVDVETDEPMFGTVKEGLFARHLTFVPLRGITIGPDNLQATVSKDQVQDAPNNRDARRRTLPDERVSPLSPLPAQLHAARDGERSPARPPLTGMRLPA